MVEARFKPTTWRGGRGRGRGRERETGLVISFIVGTKYLTKAA